ncbi:MAG TPA: thiol:disulfide interchange protein DsbA/DsbL [Burkholderiaceae bacterium]|nr:thiol:disulfide interchange protein DsbA/DsbL [Burkholderiaceae bacterium]
MKRRHFSVVSASLLGWAGAAGGIAAFLQPAHAQQSQPVEGTHYVRLTTPVPTSAAGKIEAIEFFWYGCPHCNAFEPALDAWANALPPDVAFRRVPAAFNASWEPHQRIFYALESLEALPAMHRKVFYAIHQQRLRLDKLPEIVAFMAANGIDTAKFTEAYNSFGVQTKVRQAAQLTNAYKIDGVPAIGVQGRYYTSGPLAGSNERSLLVANYLIERVRKGGGA